MNLLCPICREPLAFQNGTAVCPHRHNFDIARQGYINLLRKQSTAHGDNKEMVRARTAFLETGSYAFLRQALKEEIESEHPLSLVDLGCGEGYYTSAFEVPDKIGFDMSKEALKHASAHDASTQYVVASIFHLPLPDACADAVLTCFAPAAVSEIERILKPGGRFLFVTPGPDHLLEMKQLLYEKPYLNEEKELISDLVLEKKRILTARLHLPHGDLMNLFEMTPYAHRTPAAAIQRLAQQEQMSLTASFVLRVYRR